MYRYTTPTITITIDDLDFSNVATFRVAIEKGSTEILKEIDIDDSAVDAENSTISVALTQAETASLSKGYAEIQIRVVFTDGAVQATPIVKVAVNDVLDEVII